jgi:hypothetical protein
MKTNNACFFTSMLADAHEEMPIVVALRVNSKTKNIHLFYDYLYSKN